MTPIDSDYIGRLDLNLLRTLDTLLTERNVTRTAKRLHVTQPSVSAQLARLRAFFDDPLLVPGPRGMRPTVRAEALRAPLRHALSQLETAIAPPSPFAPDTSTLTWRIAAADYGERAVLPSAVAHIRNAAPGTRLAIVPRLSPTLDRDLESGELDLALHTLDDAPKHLRSRLLFHESYVLVGRKSHPKLRRRPTLAQFCDLEHVMVSPDGGGFVGPTDAALAERGRERRVVLSVPRFQSAIAAIASSHLVAMLPSRLVADRKDLVVHRAPIDIPGFDLAMVWHERSHRDPAHRWLRECIVGLL